jgi:glycosyltransferase involved in cell wall biosynthesis
MVLVSVLMTAWNREAYIAEAIESVLASSLNDFELIIVDDASADRTFSVAASLAQKDTRIKLFSNPENLGDYPNRNRAAALATGKYIKYVDSDDVLYEHGLQTMVDAMEKFPQAAFGFSDVRSEPAASLPRQYSGEEALRIHFLQGGLLHAGPGSSIIRKDVFDKMGGFSGTRFISDYEAWLQLCLQYPVVIFANGLTWLRTHRGQENDVGKLAYYSLNYNLHKSFFNNGLNPFSRSERKILLYNYRILLSRRIYQRLLPWYGFKKTMEAVKSSGENLSIFLHAFLPMKKITG